MTINPDFESVHPRADDGAFTEKAQGAPDIEALSVDALQAKRDRADSAREALLQTLWATRNALVPVNAKFIALSILAEVPDARFLALEESDQEGCSWYPTDILGEDSSTVEYHEDIFDEIQNVASELPESIPGSYEQGETGKWEFIKESGFEWLIISDNGQAAKIDLRLAAALGE